MVLTRQQIHFENTECYPSLQEALKACENDEHIYVLGGDSVYRQAIEFADELCLTLIKDTPAQADTFFPPFINDWEVTFREDHDIDEKHQFKYSFVNYKEKRTD